MREKEKQGRIHGKIVADGWARAIKGNPLAIKKKLERTDGPTRQGVESRFRDLRNTYKQHKELIRENAAEIEKKIEKNEKR